MTDTAKPRLLMGGDKSVFYELNNQFSWAEEALFCVSYARYQAFRFLNHSINDFLRRGGALRALFDIERFFTDPEIIEELCTIPGDSECRVYYRSVGGERMENQAGPLHAKVYLFKKKSTVRALIGSSNFTVGGLRNNIESNVLLEGSMRVSFFKEILQSFDELWDSHYAVRPEDHYEIIEHYKRFVEEDRENRRNQQQQARHRSRTLCDQFRAARKQLHDAINTDIAYLMGLISGGGYKVDENTIRIRYHKGIFNRGTEHEGFIYSPGISSLRMRQSTAFKRDILGICERLKRFFKRTETKDRVSYKKRSDYDYDIFIYLDPMSMFSETIKVFLSHCKIVRKRIVPVLPIYNKRFEDRNILASFIRGYADVRARISPTDREGTDGPLRIALSFSTGTEEFAREVQKVFEKKFSMQRINFLLGSSRGRETMLRIDPVEIRKVGPQKFFSLNWKQLLLADYSSFNRQNFSQRYK